MKKIIVFLLKISVSVAIIGYLVNDAYTTQNADGENVFQLLRDTPKDWPRLTGAWVLCASAVALTLIRWWCLVRALDLPLRLSEAFRIGFVGYLFNMAPMGIVGGDLLKGAMLSHRHPQYKAKAFASVVIDRIIGLYMLFVVATVAILVTGFNDLPTPPIVHRVCQLTYLCTGIGGVMIGMLLIPGITDGRATQALGRLPRIGPTISQLIEAVRMYRQRPGVLFVSAAMSIGVHSLFATGIYLIARGLLGDVLSLDMHFVVAPLSAVTQVIPLPAGPMEFALEFFYQEVHPHVLGAPNIDAGEGLVVSLAYRLICMLIAMVGVCYYFAARSEVAEAMHEVEEEQAINQPTVE